MIKQNNAELWYEILGENNKQDLILISGLGSQMIRWDDDFCALLVQKGFRVIRFDNRDSGCSVFLSERKEEYGNNLEKAFEKVKAEGPPYSLYDMTADVIALLDHLHIDKAHIAGRSMGGIIAQLIGADFPERVLSLTIIMSTSLNPALPPVTPDVMTMMTRKPIDPNADREGYIQDALAFARRIGGTKYPFDENKEIELIEIELKRSRSKNGTLRQLLALGTMVFDAAKIKQITVPVVIIHGTDDPIFHPDCATDLARLIPHAKLLLMEGMGHAIPPELYSYIVAVITEQSNKTLL